MDPEVELLVHLGVLILIWGEGEVNSKCCNISTNLLSHSKCTRILSPHHHGRTLLVSVLSLCKMGGILLWFCLYFPWDKGWTTLHTPCGYLGKYLFRPFMHSLINWFCFLLSSLCIIRYQHLFRSTVCRCFLLFCSFCLFILAFFFSFVCFVSLSFLFWFFEVEFLCIALESVLEFSL